MRRLTIVIALLFAAQFPDAAFVRAQPRAAAPAQDHWAMIRSANDLQRQGRHSEAEALYRAAAAAAEKTKGPRHIDVASALNNLANVLLDQSKHGEVEALYRRALGIQEERLGPNHASVARTVHNLGTMYEQLGQYSKAEALYVRARAIREQVLGPKHSDVAQTIHHLGNVSRHQREHGRAERLYAEAIAIYESLFGAADPRVAGSLLGLGNAYLGTRRFAEAERAYTRALAIFQERLGQNHPAVALARNNLAEAYREQRNFEPAEQLYKQALATREQALHGNHPDLAQAYHNLALLNGDRGDAASALEFSRKASAILRAHVVRNVASGPTSAVGDFVKSKIHYFHTHLDNLAGLDRADGSADAFAREAFDVAQQASHSAAAAAVEQMAVRFSKGGGPLASLIRELQDLSDLRRSQDSQMVELLASRADQQSARGTLRTEIETTESRRATAAERLRREFPDYAALASPVSVDAAQVQRLLAAGEALLFVLTGEQSSYVFALTQDAFMWVRISSGRERLAMLVASFRRGLDLDELERSSGSGAPGLFDLGLAHDLHGLLLGPVASLLDNKRHILFVPTGPLTALPLHLLVIKPPSVARPSTLSDYREAAWLAKESAVTVLPSVSSLRALRSRVAGSAAPNPMIGFGDPLFAPGSQAPPARGTGRKAQAGAQRTAPAKPASRRTRAYTSYWTGAGVDRDALAKALPRLPDTADELIAIGRRLGARKEDLHLGAAATEARVKSAKLADYRVVYFATHGLVAGDVSGVAEPSLALSLPARPSSVDDGLLTASEVAQLNLNADWIVLSACNTIAGDRPGAEALSGLARAFVYAGARALLVSHWAVDSNAATRLTTATFGLMQSDPAIGRAEALRQAMLAYMNDLADPRNAYPAYWAPFVIVGEGGTATAADR
jgi:CHAT domain-containing protein/tetratricopeptide (TPR) repeat protein